MAESGNAPVSRFASRELICDANKATGFPREFRVQIPTPANGVQLKEIIFAYNEPAAIIKDGRKKYLVVGDLHIGKELKLAASGIKIYDSTERMADRIIALAKLHKAKNIVLLGDVKDSIIRPDSVEMRIIQSFFRKLSDYTVFLVQGNHDAGLGEIPNIRRSKELRIGKVGLLHGNALPSEDLMRCDYLIAGHDHPAAMITSGLEKVWVVLDIKPRVAAKEYPNRNAKARLILMPAFNDLITGTDISRGRVLNPLIRRGLFDLRKAKLYTIKGDLARMKLNGG